MLRFIERDGKNILQEMIVVTGMGGNFADEWKDVPLVKEGKSCHPKQHDLANVYGMTRCDKCGNFYKEEKKSLAERLYNSWQNGCLHPKFENTSFQEEYERLASEAVKAVLEEIESYEDGKMKGLSDLKDRIRSMAKE